MPKVLLTGSKGQLGIALQASKPKNIDLIPLTKKELNLADKEECKRIVLFHKPDWVINAGAYTDVEGAENNFSLVNAINAEAPKALAEALAEINGGLLQISTDFVFDGEKGNPYKPNDKINPLNIYGASKASSESSIRNLDKGIILRTSWLYGPIGKNFVISMLKLHSIKGKNNESISVVSDQIGSPTNTKSLALACWACLKTNGNHIYHWSDSGCASWYDFAIAIGEFGTKSGLLKKPAEIIPISAKEYPSNVNRPYYSVLDCFETSNQLNLKQAYWRDSLCETINQLNIGNLSTI